MAAAPLTRHFLEECGVDDTIELVDIYGIDPPLEPLVFRLMPSNRLLLLLALVGMAGVQRLAHPFEHRCFQ